MRFLVECYRAIRAQCGDAFPISLKLNSADFLRGGFNTDEAAIVARTITEEGLDLLEISGGTFENPQMFLVPKDSSKQREAHFLEYAKMIRQVTSCPLMLTGGLRTPQLMADIISDGSVDLIGLARPMAQEPDIPRQILAGRSEPSRCKQRRILFDVLAPVLDGGWYQLQINRMSQGKEPKPNIGVFQTITVIFRGFWQWKRLLEPGIKADKPQLTWWKRRSFWLLMKSLPILIYLVGFYFGFVAVDRELETLGRVFFIGNGSLHILEIPIALTIGRRLHLGTTQIVIKTLFFGFTWWLPLRWRN